MTNIHLASAAPNLSIIDIDIYRLRLDDEVFTMVPQLRPAT
jgi:hypothetical protein